MKNKKTLFALTAFTAAVVVSAGLISERRKKRYSSEEKIKQAEEYKKAAKKCHNGETVEYSPDKYSGNVTSKDFIRKAEKALECMDALEDYFLYSKTDSADKPQEHYSPFYYGNHWHKQTPVMLNRRNLSIPTNHLLCGFAGTGKTSLMEHEIESVLHHTNDKVFVITATNEYNAIADGYNALEMIDDRKNKPIHILDDKRFVVYSLEKIRYEIQTQNLSQSASIEEIRYAVQSQPLLNQSVLPEYYLKCLETIWEYVCNNVNSERLSWIFIDDIQDIMCDERCMSLLTDIIKEAITHGCTVTLAIQRLYNLSENDIGKSLLENINLLTLFTLGVADKEFILNYFKDILSEADALFLEQLCYKRQCGTGLYIINNRLIDDNSSGNLTAIPFEIKL